MAFVPIYLLILLVTILIDYYAGIWIEASQGRKKRLFLIVSVISTCAVLGIFKYYNFFIDNVNAVSGWLGWGLHARTLAILLPIGLSFHTFQSLSYVIEVYRGHQKAERNFIIYSLYVMFYPQLVAGPIERPQNLLRQFREEKFFEYQRVADGLKLMAWGMFKKVVIADRLAEMVDRVYNHPSEFSGLALIIATVAFAFQIFCDFSGYSDIAIGSARVMGFELMTNFNRPYHSRSIAEFWKRWHISLSTWFRDYVYISLGGNRCSRFRWQFNLFITFLLSGLWHGANFTFVTWGALNGLYLVASLWTGKWRSRLAEQMGLSQFPGFLRSVQIGTTFALICFSWIFFRANSMSDALYIVKHLFSGPWVWPEAFALSQIHTVIIPLLALEIVHLIQRKTSILSLLAQRPAWIRYSVYATLIMTIAGLGVFRQSQFIYFQF